MVKIPESVKLEEDELALEIRKLDLEHQRARQAAGMKMLVRTLGWFSYGRV